MEGEGRELLENVTLADGAQYIMQRMDNSQLLTADLLQHHNEIVVDLEGNDFIPVNYTSEDLLPQDLTEEDRNLAAALVAVQLSQQQKQQQLQQDNTIINTALPSLVSTAGLGKQTPAINGSYLQIVDSDNLYKQELPKLIDSRDFQTHTVYDRSESINVIKTEDEDQFLAHRDSDGDNRSDARTSKKVLPHKKRISRKLKKNNVPMQKVHKCNLCGEMFSNAEEFVQHRQICEVQVTTMSVQFTCQICSSGFNDQLQFFQHLKRHYEPSMEHVVVENNSCLKLESENQQAHLLQQEQPPFNCFKCQKSFRKQESLDNHMKTFHKCSQKVNYEFPEAEAIISSIQVPESGHDEENKAWYREDELHATEEDLREMEEQEHICQICKRQFGSSNLLVEHSIRCSGDIETEQSNGADISPFTKVKRGKKTNSYHCTLCDKVFVHKNSLVYHMRGHTGTRPHQCDQCTKSFFSSSALKIHLRMHTGDKPYKCEYCGKAFRQWGDLKYHCISIHSDQRQYHCEYCGKDFARKYSLVLHRRIHTGEKNYTCEYCAKSFRASTYLKNHIRIHTGEKPYTCDLCGKKFRVSSDMKRHLRTHSRKRLQAAPLDQDLKIKDESSESALLKIEDSPERLKEEGEASAVPSLQYEGDPMNGGRDNTLYIMPVLIA